MPENLSAGTMWFYKIYKSDPYAKDIDEKRETVIKKVPKSDELLINFLKGEDVWLGWRFLKDIEIIDVNQN